MSKKNRKSRRAADEMKHAVKAIAAERQATIDQLIPEGPTDNDGSDPALATGPAVGNTYYGSDGNAYEVTAIKNGVITAKLGGKNIPFPVATFEELVGFGNQEASAANAAKAAELVAQNKAAAEKAAADKVAAGQAAVEKKKAEKEARKATAGANGVRRVSGMWVIRDTLAKNPNATLEEVSKACEAAGVPKGNSTITTIMSDFKQTYQALLGAGRIRTLH